MSRYNDQLEDELDMALENIATLRAENEALRAQLATARADALEEAAKVADMHDHRGDIGNAIRALKEKQP